MCHLMSRHMRESNTNDIIRDGRGAVGFAGGVSASLVVVDVLKILRFEPGTMAGLRQIRAQQWRPSAK